MEFISHFIKELFFDKKGNADQSAIRRLTDYLVGALIMFILYTSVLVYIAYMDDNEIEVDSIEYIED